jgi:glutamate/tyrosine decarboxylase-like PLP-dependent enzyme
MADWHPEPQLIWLRDEATSRGALREAGAATWEAALDYLYRHAFDRAMGLPNGHDELRALYFERTGGSPGPAPHDPSPLVGILEEWAERIAPHTLSAYHPRSLSYFTPPPLVASIAGEILSQVAQQGIDVWHAGPVGAFVEEEVVRWLCDLVGYGSGSFGLLTSGGVMANFIAMALARDVHLARLRGPGAAELAPPPRGRALEGVRVYASDQTHFSIGRALDELGFPSETLVVLPTDDAFRLHPAPVAEAIEADRANGLTPLAICAAAGSTNTGSVDRIADLAELARREALWLHVDAAYGAAVRLSERDAWRVPALELADSVTVDPHKWLFQAYDVGGVMVRNGEHLRVAFGGRRPEYYRGGERRTDAAAVAPVADGHDEPADQLNFYRLGFEGTRRWRALKLWFSWKHLGTIGLARLVEANLDLAAHLAARIAAADDFEALPPDPDLSVVCFRHHPPGRHRPEDPAALDAHQDRLQQALEVSGDGWLSTTRLRGATYLRAGIVNTQSVRADIDALLEQLRSLAAAIE